MARNNIILCDCEAIHEESVNKTKLLMEKEPTFSKLSNLFKIFSDNTRLKILWALDKGQELCVCDLAVILNMTKSAISHQLKTLKNCELIDFRKEGKIVYYSLKDEHVKSIIEVGMEHINEY